MRTWNDDRLHVLMVLWFLTAAVGSLGGAGHWAHAALGVGVLCGVRFVLQPVAGWVGERAVAWKWRLVHKLEEDRKG